MILEKNFRKFLQDNLTWTEFEELPELLGESQKATTQLLNDPTRGSIAQLTVIEKLLTGHNEAYDKDFILMNFNFGGVQQIA